MRRGDMETDNPDEPANLRCLRRMVTVLTVGMIGGVLVLIAVLVTRLSDQGPDLPRAITLPDGSRAQAFTQGRGWYAVVTEADEILIFDQLTGALRQTIAIE